MEQISIRELLLLFVIIALALGWWFDRRPIPARYQMQVVESQALVLDTATGQVWEKGFKGGYSSPNFLDAKSTK